MLGLMTASAQAQEYPSKPIRLIVGFAAGGGADVFARMIVEKLSVQLGAAIVVENKPGAAGVIGATAVVRAPPDGYTLLMGPQGSIAVAPYTQKQQPFDPLTDLVPITLLMTSQLQLYVRDDFPAKNFSEFVALVKANPGKYSFATAGVAGPGHMFTELLSRKIGLKMVHVPYPGDGQAINDVLGGTVPIWATAIASAKPYLDARSIRPIVTSGRERASFLPDTPTAEESGYPGASAYYYNALLAPKGTPEAIISKLNQAIVDIYKDPVLIERIKGLGQTPVTKSPKETADFIRADIDQWKVILQEFAQK